MLIERIKEAIEKNLVAEEISTLPRMSSAGSCPRLLDYEYQQPLPKTSVDFDSFVRMEFGHALHEKMQSMFQLALGDDLYDCEKEISLRLPSGIVVTGHPDGRIRSLKATLELKTCSEATFAMVCNENKPIDAHIDQGNLYAHVQGDEWVICIYVNRSIGFQKLLFKEFMFEYSPELAQRSIEKFEKREANKIAGVMTPRPYHDKTASPCFFCDYREKCYEGFEAQVTGWAVLNLVDSDIAAKARKAIECRDTRLLSDRMEKALTKEVGQKIANMNAKQARMTDAQGTISVLLAPGKNDNLLTTIRSEK